MVLKVIVDGKDQKCHICDSDDIGFYCKKEKYDLYKCAYCKFIFVDPIPSDLNDVYTEEYFHDTGEQEFGYTDYDTDKDSMRHVFELYLSIFEKNSPNKTILDVGCATGYFLDIAKAKGWKTYGVDISEYAVKEAESRGHIGYSGNLPELSINTKVDIITMWDVLEHVDDPRAYLKTAAGLLNEGGYIAINTVDTSSFWARIMKAKWHLIVPPEHIYYYDSNNLNLLLEQTGFKMTDVRKIAKKFSLPYFFMMGYRWQGIKIWKFFAEYFSKPRWRKISVPVNFRDTIFVLAAKK